MVLFKDINKPSSDLLKKGFPHEKAWDLEYKYNSKNPQITNTASVNAAGGFDASSTFKYTAADATAEIKMLAAGKSHIDVKYDVRKVKGLSFGTKYERKAEKAGGDAIELTSELFIPRFHGIFQVNPMLRTFNTSASVGYEAFRFGGEISGKCDVSSMKYGLGVSYSHACCKRQWMTSIKAGPAGDMMFGRVTGNIYAKATEGRGTEMAAEVEHLIPEGRTSIVFGGLWYLNDEHNTHMKAKISQNALLSLSMTHKVCDYLSATVGTQLDVSKPQNPEAVKYGLKIDVVA